MMKAIFSRYVQSLEEIHALNAYLPLSKCFQKLAMHAFPKSLINSTKNGTEKNFASQWLSISPNSMISFKFYVQTPFFSTFITLHLGKGHIFRPSTGILAQTACATASLFSGVDSIPARAPITAHQRHFQFKICGTINHPLKSSHPVASDYVQSPVLNTENHHLMQC